MLASRTLLLVLSLCGSAVGAQPFTVVTVAQHQQQGLVRTQYLVQNGADPLNRFGVERVTLAGPVAQLFTTPMILVPGLNANAQLFTLGNSTSGADFQHSIAARLAHAGLDLFIYSSRETFLAPGQCANQADCAVASSWGLPAYLSDLAFIRQLAQTEHPGRKPILGGYSLGGMVALAAASELPDAYAGIWLGDATLWITDPSLRAGYSMICGGLNGALAAGQVLDDQIVALPKQLIQLELAAPNAPTPFPFFPPGTTNRQAYLLFFTSPSMGPPASIFPTGVVLAAGSVAEDRFFFTSENRLNSQFNAFNSYVANATLRDVICSFAGDPTFVANLGNFHEPILSFQLEKGFGTLANDSLALTSSSDIEVKTYAGFGHLDLLASGHHDLLLELPLLHWVYTDVVFH